MSLFPTFIVNLRTILERGRSILGFRLLFWAVFWITGMRVSTWIVQSLSLEVFQIYFPLKCPLKFFLGLTCPTCGLGRSIIYALAGEWSSSWHAHILGCCVVLISIPATFFWALKARFLQKFRDEAQLPKT